jgi:hypothetical protein
MDDWRTESRDQGSEDREKIEGEKMGSQEDKKIGGPRLSKGAKYEG